MFIRKLLLLPRKILKINYFQLLKELAFFAKFFILVTLYLWFDLCHIICNLWPLKYITKPIQNVVDKFRDKVLAIFNTRTEGDISSLDLILLAVRHLKAKKTRTFITIGGMSVGFGSVLFLLSIGYGTQRLVVSRVARLDEMKQIVVTAGQASTLKLNDETIATFKSIDKVSEALPLVSVVSKVNYNNSVSDSVVYGVSRAFLEESAIQPIRGELFIDGEPSAAIEKQPEDVGEVAGAQIELRTDAKMYRQLSQVRYAIYPLTWKPVYAEPSDTASVIGYTTRVAGIQDAIEVWGQEYVTDGSAPAGVDLYGNNFSAWVSDSFLLWEKTPCNPEDIDCVGGEYIVQRIDGVQRQQTGYITETAVSLERYTIVPESQPVFAEGEVVDEIQFSIPSSTYAQLYAEPNHEQAQLNLFTTHKKANQLHSGELIFGSRYAATNGWGSVGQNQHGTEVGLWIRAKVPVWRKVDCTDCTELYITEQDTNDQQVETIAIIRADAVRIDGMISPPQFGRVLGDATESASLSTTALTTDATASDAAVIEEDIATEIELGNGMRLVAQTNESGEVDWVTIASDSAGLVTEQREILPFAETAQRTAVVNQVMLSVMGIAETEVIGKTFSSVLVLDQEFFDREEYQAESESTEFTIIGIIPGDKNPAFYIPFSDIQGLGVKNYSQIKVVVSDQNALPEIRQKIEGLGYKTTSVVDTVGKINDLFNTVRLLLMLLGMVAIGVAALGMFNTLTVSLLEKTREVGLMKAIGMKSNEVKRLFLAESIVMGLSGGIFGILLSTAAGYALSFGLSIFSLTKGLGYINLVYTPFYLWAGIVGVAFLVGVVTGLYPSHRATQISALNALRYE